MIFACGSLVKWYDPAGDVITTYYPKDVGNKSPTATLIHVMIHRELTAATISGHLVSLFSRAIQVARVREVFGRRKMKSWNT